MSTMKGLDLSHWNSGFDLSKSSAKFAICKATDGTSMVDSQCDHFVTQAKNSGKKWGVYHFAYTGSDAEADFFIKNTKGYHGKGILALDWEASAVSHGVSAAKNWLDRVYSKTGIKPVIYTSASVLNSYDWSPVAKAGYGLWLARWASSPGDPDPWDVLAVWQYTDAHSEQGYRLDGDEFYGSNSTWDAYAKSTAPTPDPKPDPAPDPDDDDKTVPKVEVDGVWGSGTTKQRQTILHNMGLYSGAIDGTLDHQNPYWRDRNPGLGSGWGWDSNYKGKGGSSTIRADQTRLAKKKGKDGKPLYSGAIDGLAGEDYFRALQKEQQTTVDGVVSRPSKMVKAMQTDGNAGKIA